MASSRVRRTLFGTLLALGVAGTATATTLVVGQVRSQRAQIPDGTTPCTVRRVTDGDTIVCDGDQRVRLLLIDAPEMNQRPFGTAARNEMLDLTPPGTKLQLEFDVQLRDQYGRTLAYLWLADGRMVNEEMLRRGMAVVSVYPPNVRHVDRFRAVADEAKRAKIGLWAVNAFECEPRDHRAGRC